ncbi:hypothetical protein NXS19_001717 [Fusarium pseudograminearum]|nr:hypothetical protein NXS19_001717 [Fusarium pseudograminearum]
MFEAQTIFNLRICVETEPLACLLFICCRIGRKLSMRILLVFAAMPQVRPSLNTNVFVPVKSSLVKMPYTPADITRTWLRGSAFMVDPTSGKPRDLSTRPNNFHPAFRFAP